LIASVTVKPTEKLGLDASVAQGPDVGQESPWKSPYASADQNRGAVPAGVGDLGERVIQDRDVVGGGIRAGVAGPSRPARASPLLSSQHSSG
jgi:hypothetical protein